MLERRKLHYLYASDGLFAIYVMNGENDTMYYVSKDYLGSFDVITDERGNVLERYSFDPWGRRRNPTDWTFTDVPAPHLFDRGFTGHEHLDKFGLINMNGRVYDPWLGRFLSPDPFVQTPTYSQSYNRYSYCLNNPLKYVDPSGYRQKPFYEWEANATYYGGGGGFNGRIGPGSGNHWSDGMNSYRDYQFMSEYTFENYYGKGAYEVASSINSNPTMQQDWRSGKIDMHQVMLYGSYWNPVAGEEAYRESEYKNGKQYVNIYCYGKWVSIFNNVASSSEVTPFDVGLEWLTGTGPRHRDFTNGDVFTEMIRQHDHVMNTLASIPGMIANGKMRGNALYSLSGVQGVMNYVKDYSTLATGGLTGNLAVTYLGSYNLQWEVTAINGNSATIQFLVNNTSSIQSATRPPVIGYYSWWQNSVGSWINSSFSSGPMSITTQTFRWTETVTW